MEARERSRARRADAHGGRTRHAFAWLAGKATLAAGSPWGFGVAASIVLAWAMAGPLFGFSDTWQLFINTGTTIVTFLMVFLIQHTQSKDTQAVQLKLNELIAAVAGASNRLVDIEDLSEEELSRLRIYYRQLADRIRTGDEPEMDRISDEHPPGPHPPRGPAPEGRAMRGRRPS